MFTFTDPIILTDHWLLPTRSSFKIHGLVIGYGSYNFARSHLLSRFQSYYKIQRSFIYYKNRWLIQRSVVSPEAQHPDYITIKISRPLGRLADSIVEVGNFLSSPEISLESVTDSCTFYLIY